MTQSDNTPDSPPTPDLIGFSSVRLLQASEPDAAIAWQEGLIKQLTGGEPVEVREVRGEFLDPVYRLRISGRHPAGSGGRGQ